MGSYTSFVLCCLLFCYFFYSILYDGNDLFKSYIVMFEIAVSQSQNLRQLLTFYVPIYDRLFVGFLSRLVKPNFADAGSVGQGNACSASGSGDNQSCSEAAHPREEAENPGGRRKW